MSLVHIHDLCIIHVQKFNAVFSTKDPKRWIRNGEQPSQIEVLL